MWELLQGRSTGLGEGSPGPRCGSALSDPGHVHPLGNLLFCDSRGLEILPLTPPRSEIHSSTKTSLSWGDFMASALSVHPTLSYSCVLTEMDRWRACLGHLQREDPWPFCGHISAHQEGKDAPLQAPFGSLAWSAVFSASAPWRRLRTQCPHTSG